MTTITNSNPHWKDFYSEYERYISMVEIRPNRKLAVLNIVNQNKNNPFVFFIHGACARMSQFESLIKALSPKFNIIAFDRIGCGYSSKPTEYSSYNDISIFLDLCALFENYIPQSSIHHKHEILIISHSFGCSQTIKLLSKFSNSSVYNYDVKSVILIGAASLILGKNLPLFTTSLFSLPHWILEYLSSALAKGFRTKGIHPNAKKVNELEKTFAGVNPPYMYTAFYLQIIPCSDMEFKTFCKSGINTMIIHGIDDGIVSIKNAKTLFNKLNKYHDENKNYLVQFSSIKEASHQVMQEKPQIVYDIIDNFWSKCCNPTATSNANQF